MRKWMLAFAVLAGTAIGSSAEAAGPAQYWIIAPESTAAPILTPRPKTRYSYGWFGVSQPYRTAGYHHGYQNTYVDWTFR
ncbi:hypothetical protein Pan97_44450 [Bremerella volcania]|uniref:Uncharacterized protein n=1 Tax=Bremerella volcania TaxID=2527984 RepID=A0A518CDS7_9BACT|nr:hypothetical protein [Bremerella volcania]QDU77378.1 hypothetical protein Pan97_44450 [Bremerella volcania]